jgi:hypothetical protein
MYASLNYIYVFVRFLNTASILVGNSEGIMVKKMIYFFSFPFLRKMVLKR